MPHYFKHCCAAAMLAAMQITAAQAQISDTTLRDLSACDASFFRSLQKDGAAFADKVPLVQRGEYSWFKVANRYKESGSKVMFSAPLLAGKLKVLGYSDDVSDLGKMGRYYSWAFFVEGKVEDVYQQLKPLIHDDQRVRRDDSAYARSEIRLPDGGWQAFVSAPDEAVGLDRVERVLLIEPHDTLDNVVRVGCSLQGGVGAEVLREIRPDIDASEYPKLPNAANAYDSAPLPPEVLSVVKAALAAAPVWQPKFKSMHYVSKRTPLKPAGEIYYVGQTLRVHDEWIDTAEQYSPQFTMQRLKLAGLVQLRSTMKEDVSHSYLSTIGLSLSLPATLAAGTKFQFSMTTINVPAGPREQPEQTTTECEIKDTFPARTIFPTLTGDATRFICINQKDGYLNESALVHDLGVAMGLRSVSQKYGGSTSSYQDLEVVQ